MGCVGSRESEERESNEFWTLYEKEDGFTIPQISHDRRHYNSIYYHYKNRIPDTKLFEASQGDKPDTEWLKYIQPPPYEIERDLRAPEFTLQPEHIFGYNVMDCRKNLYFALARDRIIFPAAAMVVTMDRSNRSQKFLCGGDIHKNIGHDDQIAALTVSQDSKYAVSGQVGPNPYICVWDLKKSEILYQVRQAGNSNGVRALTIDKENKYFASISMDQNQKLYVYDMKSHLKVSEIEVGKARILDIQWSTDGKMIACGGKEGMEFFTLKENNLESIKVDYGDFKAKSVVTLTYDDSGKCYAGTNSGYVLIFKENQCIGCHKVMPGMIGAIKVTPDFILIGGNREIQKLSHDFSELTPAQNTLMSQSKRKKSNASESDDDNYILVTAPVRALDFRGSIIIAGLRDGSIIEVDAKENITVLMNSHSHGILSGLAIDSNNEFAVTAGDDDKIMVWDLKRKKRLKETTISESQQMALMARNNNSSGDPVKEVRRRKYSLTKYFHLQEQASAIQINPVYSHLAVGVNTGEILIFKSFKTFELIKILNNTDDWCRVLEYSPDGAYLAVGCNNGKIYIYDEDYKLRHSYRGDHLGAIISLDWTPNNRYLMSECSDLQHECFDLITLKKVSTDHVLPKLDEWATCKQKGSWLNEGIIFPYNQSIKDVSAINLNKVDKYMVVGDKWGLIKLFRYPCVSGSSPNVFRGHSKQITKIVFDGNNRRILTVGGDDNSLIIWKIVAKEFSIARMISDVFS